MKRRERQWSTTHRYQSVCFMAPLIFSLGLSFIFTFSSLSFPSRRPDTCPTWCIPCASVEPFSLWPTYAKRGEPIIKFISSLLNLSLLKSCQTSHLCQPPLKSHLLKILVRSECFLHFSLIHSCLTSTLSIFKTHLKTHSFSLAFDPTLDIDLVHFYCVIAVFTFHSLECIYLFLCTGLCV